MKMRKIVAIVAAVLMLLSVMPIAAFAADTEIIFELGANGDATHKDGSTAKTDYTETVGDYTLSITGGTKMYPTSYDAKGNSCIKLGTGSAVGGFSLTAPDNVTSVIIAAGKYKANATVLDINSTTYTLTNSSNDGAYDSITIDTTSTKTITLTTTSSGKRAMINSITYVVEAGSTDPDTPTCEHVSDATYACQEGTCTLCGETVAAVAHKYSNACVAECEYGCGTANPDYADHVYSGDYDASCNVCAATRDVTLPEADSELTIPEANALGAGLDANTYTEGKYYVSGVIESIDNTTYGNVYIQDEDGNKLYVYGVYSADGTVRYDAMDPQPIVGDTVKLYGVIGNYYGSVQMKNSWLADLQQTGCAHDYVGVETTSASCTAAGVMTYTCSLCGDSYTEDIPVTDHTYVDGFCSVCGAEEINLVEYTITFDANMTQRTEYSTSAQVWTEGDLVFTNNKGGSSSNVGNYSNPVRLYKTSEVVIACPGMTSIVIDASSVGGTKYATPWADTLTAAGLTYTATDNIYTVTLAEPVDSITLTCSAQIRALSITVTAAAQGSAAECEHTNAVACDKYCPDCSSLINEEAAHKSDAAYPCYDGTCEYCGETVAGDGHSFDENDICTVCGQAPVPENPVDPENPQQYVFSEFAAGTQYAENEKHYLDNAVTVITTQAHFTSELRLYSSTTYNGSAIIKSTKDISAIVLNAGNKVDVLNLYVSEDGEVYQAIEITATTYNDYTVLIPEMTKYIKLDVAGDQQIRIKNMTLYFDGEVPHVCEYTAEVTKEATCGEAGVTTYTCSCGASYTEEIPATGEHVNTYNQYTYHPSNDDMHVYAIVCNDCGVMLTDWIEEECTGGQATCTDPATCEKCGLNYGDTVDHTYDDEYDADCNVCGEVREVPEKPVEVMYGDLNSDTLVDILDVAILQQYVAGWDVTLNEVVADLNGDTLVDILDVAILQQYVAGWDVTLGPVETPEEPSDDNNGFNDGTLEW